MFATSALISATITFGLPETGGRKLPDTIEDCKEQSSFSDEIRNCIRFRKKKIKISTVFRKIHYFDYKSCKYNVNCKYIDLKTTRNHHYSESKF